MVQQARAFTESVFVCAMRLLLQRASVSKVIQDALQGVQTSNYEFPLFSKTGGRIEVLLNATTRRDVEGNIVGVVGVGQDITKARRLCYWVVVSAPLTGP